MAVLLLPFHCLRIGCISYRILNTASYTSSIHNVCPRILYQYTVWVQTFPCLSNFFTDFSFQMGPQCSIHSLLQLQSWKQGTANLSSTNIQLCVRAILASEAETSYFNDLYITSTMRLEIPATRTLLFSKQFVWFVWNSSHSKEFHENYINCKTDYWALNTQSLRMYSSLTLRLLAIRHYLNPNGGWSHVFINKEKFRWGNFFKVSEDVSKMF